MIHKTLVVDITKDSIPSECLKRLEAVTKNLIFVSSGDSVWKSQLADADAVLCNISTQIDRSSLDQSPKLKYIGVQSTAYDGIDAVSAHARGITVSNLGGYSTEAVAEFVFAAVFEAIRDLERAKQQARTGDHSFTAFMGTELKDKMLGVVGAGKIGSRVAEIGLGIGMRVQYVSTHAKPELERRGATSVDLDALLASSDVVSLNVIQNEQTSRMINREKLGLMKKGAIFVNTAGFKPIDWDAMMTTVKTGTITLIFHAAHGLEADMIREFQQYKNCQFYPGIAFRTAEANAARWETFATNIEQFIQGNPQNVVN